MTSAEQRRRQWEEYVQRYHRGHPGITEDVLTRAQGPGGLTGYQWLVQTLPARPGRVVDLACGSAPLHPLLGHAESYLGIDLSEAELTVAQSRGRGPVTRADIRRVPVDDAQADTVVISMGLMLVLPVTDVLAEVRRILRPGGTFAALLPARWPFRLRDTPMMASVATGLRSGGELPQHLGPRRLRRALDVVGLSVTHGASHRFELAVADPETAHLAVDALYTPHRDEQRRARAGALLARRARPGATLPVPLRRVVATRSPG